MRRLVASLCLILPGFIAQQSFGSILPPNDLHLQKNFRSNGMTEVQFNELIDSIERIYKPIVEGFGKEFKVKKLWESTEVNAYAGVDEDLWYIDMHGGLARREEVTLDGLALVM